MTKIAMRKMNSHVVVAFTILTVAFGTVNAIAEPVECASPAGKVKAVTDPNGYTVTTKFQFDSPNLEPLLSTTIKAGRGCLVAHLSGLARITDNYIVFQVRVDGVPMEGQLPRPGLPPDPVVFVSIDAAPGFDDEQFSDPTKVVAYNFFTEVGAGVHTVEVLAAAGSNIDPANPPQVNSLVLTLEYR